MQHTMTVCVCVCFFVFVWVGSHIPYTCTHHCHTFPCVQRTHVRISHHSKNTTKKKMFFVMNRKCSSRNMASRCHQVVESKAILQINILFPQSWGFVDTWKERREQWGFLLG